MDDHWLRTGTDADAVVYDPTFDERREVVSADLKRKRGKRGTLRHNQRVRCERRYGHVIVRRVPNQKMESSRPRRILEGRGYESDLMRTEVKEGLGANRH